MNRNLFMGIIISCILFVVSGCIKVNVHRKAVLTRKEICINCGSTRQVWSDRKPMLLYKSAHYISCRHSWKIARHRAIDTPIPNGTIILVKKEQVHGAFIIDKENTQGEHVAFNWYYRPDGKGSFNYASAGYIKSGRGVSAPDLSGLYEQIAFGPFKIGWEVLDYKRGYVFYPHFDGESFSQDDIRICITNKTDIRKIDAADSKWKYKASP